MIVRRLGSSALALGAVLFFITPTHAKDTLLLGGVGTLSRAMNDNAPTMNLKGYGAYGDDTLEVGGPIARGVAGIARGAAIGTRAVVGGAVYGTAAVARGTAVGAYRVARGAVAGTAYGAAAVAGYRPWYGGYYRPWYGYARPWYGGYARPWYGYSRPWYGYYRPWYGYARPWYGGYYRPWYGYSRPWYGYSGISYWPGLSVNIGVPYADASYQSYYSSSLDYSLTPVYADVSSSTAMTLPAGYGIDPGAYPPNGLESLPPPLPCDSFRYDGGPRTPVPMPFTTPPVPTAPVPVATNTVAARPTKKLTYPAYGEVLSPPKVVQPDPILVKDRRDPK